MGMAVAVVETMFGRRRVSAQPPRLCVSRSRQQRRPLWSLLLTAPAAQEVREVFEMSGMQMQRSVERERWRLRRRRWRRGCEGWLM